MAALINVAILGATGSVGASTLDVMARHGQRYRLQAVTANTNDQAMATICQQHRPALAVMADAAAAQRLRERLPQSIKTEVLAGSEAVNLAAVQTHCEVVMSAIVGAAGLEPTLRAVANGAKKGRGVKGTCAHFQVQRLEDHATAAGPELL